MPFTGQTLAKYLQVVIFEIRKMRERGNTMLNKRLGKPLKLSMHDKLSHLTIEFERLFDVKNARNYRGL